MLGAPVDQVERQKGKSAGREESVEGPQEVGDVGF